MIWYADNGAFTKCDGVTDCNFKTIDSGWIGSVDDCAALCANFAFTDFTSSTCYKALVFTTALESNCNLYLWDVVTEPSKDKIGRAHV